MPEPDKNHVFTFNPVTEGNAVIGGITLIVDPKAAIAKKKLGTPQPGPPTSTDHRFTVVAPTPDETIFNVGKGYDGPVKGLSAGRVKHIKDTGITGRTKSHVHFETTEFPKTVLSLGKPATDAAYSNVFDGKVPKEAYGVSLVTQGNAFHGSHDQFYIVSDIGDVQIRACEKKVGVQASKETVSIEAGKDVTVAAHLGGVTIGACPKLKPEDKRYQTPLVCSVGHALDQGLVADGLKMLDVTRGVLSFAQGFPTTEWQSRWGKKGRSKTTAMGTVKLLADTVKLLSTIGRWHAKSYLEAAGKVGIRGASAANMSGGISAGIYGGLSASVTSLVSASMLGLVSASVKGLAWAGVWSSLGTSIKSMKDASIEGQLGKCKVAGKAGVELLSVGGKVSVDGEKGVQLESSGGPVLAHSQTEVKCVAGTDKGYGLAAYDNGAWMGRLGGSASNFADVMFDSDRAIHIGAQNILLKYDKSEVALDPTGIQLRFEGSEMKAGKKDLQLEASGKITLG